MLANDTDPDTTDTLSVQSFTATTNGGSVTQNLDGTLKYTPGANAQALAPGEDLEDTFSYTAVDETGATATAQVTVTVTGANDAPTANDDTDTVGEDGTVDIDVLANDTDPDTTDTLSVQSFTATTNGGSVTQNLDGTLKYTPGANAQALAPGEDLEDTFSYTAVDETGATATAQVTVTVTGANDAPTANDDTDTVGEDGTVDIDVLANDTDPDLANSPADMLHVASVTGDSTPTAARAQR